MSSGKNFYIFSTHLEVGEDYTDVRLKSAELIVARENQLNISGLPVFIVGDMNPIAPTEKAMRKFRETYIDSWQQADMDGVREGPVGSMALIPTSIWKRSPEEEITFSIKAM